jgi:hypothetical protein
MPERKCQECGDTLRGRADQKYCNDQCRNAFNNKLMSETNNMVRQINRILKKNQLILSFLNPAGKATVNQSDLLINGFNFNYFTNVHASQNGRIYHFCYDHGYSVVEGDKILLVRKEGYADESRPGLPVFGINRVKEIRRGFAAELWDNGTGGPTPWSQV